MRLEGFPAHACMPTFGTQGVEIKLLTPRRPIPRKLRLSADLPQHNADGSHPSPRSVSAPPAPRAAGAGAGRWLPHLGAIGDSGAADDFRIVPHSGRSAVGCSADDLAAATPRAEDPSAGVRYRTI